VGLGQFATFVIARRAYFLILTVLQTLLAFAWIRESPARLFRAVLTASRQPDTESVAGEAQPAIPGGDPSPAAEAGAQNDNPNAVVK
jgi:hypothetical protein